MNRSIRRSLLAAAAVALFAAPAFAQKTGATSVVEVEKPARTAVQIYYDCMLDTCSSTYIVPAGMRLVVESVLGKLTGSANAPINLLIGTQLNGAFAGEIWLSPSGWFPQNNFFVSPYKENVRMYSDTTPSIEPITSVSSSTDSISLIGYLVKK